MKAENSLFPRAPRYVQSQVLQSWYQALVSWIYRDFAPPLLPQDNVRYSEEQWLGDFQRTPFKLLYSYNSFPGAAKP